MSISVTWYIPDKVLSIKIDGGLSLQDMTGLISQLELHKQIVREFHQIYDLTAMTKLPGLTGQNSIVMVTSPPLPTRHIDLDRQRLDRMIHTTVPRLRIFDRHDHHTESLAAVEMRRVATYERFVESLLAHAQRLQCTALAIEMSTRPAPQGTPCDELLVQKLPDYGFKLLDVDRSVREATGIPGSASARPREWLSTVCAVALQPPVITDCPSSTLPSDSRSTEQPEP